MGGVLSPAHSDRGGSAAPADAVLRHVDRLASQAGVPIETAQLSGEPAPRILYQARSWQADLIVVGRSGTAEPGQLYVGSQTQHVLEFAGTPVLVVPRSS